MKKIFCLLLSFVMMFGCIALAETYTAEGQGMMGPITVTVDYSDGVIHSVIVDKHTESAGISDPAIEQIPASIVKHQSIAVDTVSGATKTSVGILTAVENALIAAGADVESFKVAPEKAEIVAGETEETDIVIVGAGLAGLMAADELLRSAPNVKFIVLEKQGYVSGSVMTSGGYIVGVSSYLHERDGVQCTTDDIAVMFQITSDTDDLNATIVGKVYEKSDVTINRLIDAGHVFNDRTYQSSSYSDKVYTLITKGGGAAFGKFLNEYAQKSAYDLRMGSTVESLIVEDGVVKGVVVVDSEKRYEIRAKKVVLATGGFGANPEMMAELLPQFASVPNTANPGATGDGFKMVEQFGTKIVGEGSMGTTSSADGSWMMRSKFYVNVDGERFIGENEPSYAIQRAISQQKGGYAFQIVDDTFENKDWLNEKVEGGSVKKYDTLEELAADNGINVETLLATVAAYNAAAEKGEDIPAKEYSIPAASATSMKVGPYYIEKIVPNLFGTIPGIEINDDFQVLDGEGKPVENLYAIGELVVGNVFSRQYPGGGIGISWAANSGRYIGEQLGAELNAAE